MTSLANNRDFLRKAWTIGVPIAAAQLIQTSLNTLDVFMIGQLGEVSIAGLGLANQISFLFILICFGIASGTGIFIAQYWGKKGTKQIQKVVGLGMMMMVVPIVIFVAAGALIPEKLLGFYTNDPLVIAEGVRYLRIVVISYAFSGVTFMFTMAARGTEYVKIPFIVSSFALLLNSFLNYGLIFGNFGFPALGVQGAAIGTTISRVLEFGVMILVSVKMKAPYIGKLSNYFSYDQVFFKKVIVTAAPALINEIFWALGITVYNAVYARIGTEAFAAVNIVASIEGLAFVLFIGLGSACGIVIGNQLGAGHEENAKFFAKRFLQFAMIGSFVFGFILILMRPWVLDFYRLSDVGMNYAMRLMLLSGLFLFVRTSNFTIIIGILRSGGDTKFAMWTEIISVWGIGVPMAIVGAFVFHLPVYWVYVMIACEELVKLAISYRRYRSMRWINNLVSEKTDDLEMLEVGAS